MKKNPSIPQSMPQSMSHLSVKPTDAALKNATLDWNESGTPVSEQFDDVYFSNHNGLAESRYVFIEQNQLVERWQQSQQARFVIAETGFGTGLNFLAVWQAFDTFRQANPDAPLTQLHFISFEKYPVHIDDLRRAHQAWPELTSYAKQLQAHYPIAVPECHRLIIADGMITLDLWFGDIHHSLPKLIQTNAGLVDAGFIDAWFLDGFAPSKNSDMWNEALFNAMANLSKINGSCATFTAAGFVRRGLAAAGFEMKKVKGFAHKREMLAGRLTQSNITHSNNTPAPWFAITPAQNMTADDSIAIIGGGIASASLALALHRRGIKVSLYCEDDAPSLGASSNRQGAIYPLIAEPDSYLNRFFAPAFLFARQWIEQAAQQLTFAHDFCGVTQLAWSNKAQGKLEKMLLNQYPNELLHWLDAKQTSETIGLDVDMPSIHYPLGGWLSPKQLTQAVFTYLAEQDNVDLNFHCKIECFDYDKAQDLWQLFSADNPASPYQHKTLVVANGYQFSQFEQLSAIAATPVKGQVSHVPTTKELAKLKTVLCYDGYMTPQNPNNNHHCIGASHDRNQIDTLFDEHAQQQNVERLRNCLPNQNWPLEVDSGANLARQGIRSVTRDHLPFVGNVCDFGAVADAYAQLDPQKVRNNPDLMPEIPHYPNLFCFVALGARGLCSAPLLGEVLAAQMLAEPLPLPKEVLEKLHPARMWVRKMLKGRPLG